MLSISVIKEKKNGENRVSLIPKDILNLSKIGFRNIFVENNAGLLSGYKDSDYIKYGSIIKDKNNIWNSKIILKIHFPNFKELYLLNDNSILICLDINLNYINYLEILKKKKITLIILSYMPRISRLQIMDVLSSISYVSGYRAVIESIYEYRNFIGNQIFPCGKIKPINVLIIGAGIFGLSVTSFFKNLGANVYVYDINKNIKEEIISLGARFIDIKNDSLNIFLSNKINKFNIIVNSAISKDKKYPLIFTKKILSLIKFGSVIINLINNNSSNCILIKKNGLLNFNNIKIISYEDFSNLMPKSISKLYSNNLINFLKSMLDKDNNIILDFKDILFQNVVVLYKGKEINRKNKLKMKKNIYEKKDNIFIYQNFFLQYSNELLLILLIFYILISLFFYNYNIYIYLNNLFIFLFSYILGFISINKIKNFLHTPLMSLTNAISSIVIIGCLLQINENTDWLNISISLITLSLVNINIFSGFLITKRMLTILFN